MNSSPIISVIIPAYNAEKYIKETIDSVLSQSFPAFEIIIIDDGSTDRTLAIVSAIKDTRIRVFEYQHSGKPSIARNRGIRMAAGQYIAFLDADDLWTNDKLELQYQEFLNNPKAALVYSLRDLIDKSGSFVRWYLQPHYKGVVFEKILLHDFIGSGSNPLVKRKALERIGLFDETLDAAEDHDLWIRLAKFYEFALVPKVQVFYRQSDSSVSSDLWRQLGGSMKVIDKAFSDAPDSLQKLKNKAVSIRYLCVAGLSSDMTGHFFYLKRSLKYIFKALFAWPLSFFTVKYHWAAFKNTFLFLFPFQKTQMCLDRIHGFLGKLFR